MIRNEQDAGIAGELLMAFRELAENHAWREEISQVLAAAREEHLAGCTAQGVPPEKRAEHIEAFHLAEKLSGYCESRMAELQEDLRAYARTATEMDSATALSLA